MPLAHPVRRSLTLVALASAAVLASCAKPPPPATLSGKELATIWISSTAMNMPMLIATNPTHTRRGALFSSASIGAPNCTTLLSRPL